MITENNTQQVSILVVDDEQSQREILSGYLRKKNHKLFTAGSADEAIDIYKKQIIDIVITDLKMGTKSGLQLLREIRSLNPNANIIVVTAFGSVESAVAAMKDGAYDYLTKPINLDELDLIIDRLKERNRLISENLLLKEQLADKFSFEGIISQSAEMENVLNNAARVAKSDASVLIRGESGTGKELIAKAIHFSSNRKDKPFIAVNCAALNENLLESELFGHEKGAFTGADRQRRGRFELAHGGTLFLDEIGDIPISTQIKLLRVLQERQFERLGGSETINVDVRIISATNKDIDEAVKQNLFREDLYYRLNVVTIEIPPLRKRREDIPPLLEYYLSKYTKDNKKNLSFSKEAWELLVRYDYPGNVRELQNIVQRAVVMSRGEYIKTEDLPKSIQGYKEESTLPMQTQIKSLPEQIEKLEKDLIFEALRLYAGNQSKAAKHLGISERNLRYKLKKWGVK